MKKVLSLVLVALMIVACVATFASCGEKKEDFTPVAKENVKIGLITLHDDSSAYDKNFIESMYRALENLGMSRDQLVMYSGIEETSACYDAAKLCVNQGCQVVFADSFGHEDFLIQAAQEYTNVRFCHATGTKAHDLGADNFSNAFAAIYEGRYLAGVAAGEKLNEMIATSVITAEQAVIGYVGAFTYAEVMSGYTSFYLGAKSVCPSVTMKVKFTGSWYDYDKEKAAAEALIDAGCVLISQHADSYGAPEACEAKNVPNVTYNGSTESVGPNTYIIYSKIDWTPYFEYMINCVISGEKIDTDWVGTIANGAVKIGDLNTKAAAANTQTSIDAAKTALANGLKVFDTSKFTVNGQTLTSYMADVNFDTDYTKDTEVIADGYFHESEYRSAPYFDVEIDGITLLDRNYGEN